MSTATDVATGGTGPEAGAVEHRVVHRVVFPTDQDADTLPLYLDLHAASAKPADDDAAAALPAAGAGHLGWLDGRRSMTVPEGTRASLATYFNAFPAAYWRRWTTATAVRLSVRTEGDGIVTVYRTNARGNAQRVVARQVSGSATEDVDLSLAPFGDGGWYWFDLTAGSGDLRLVEASWAVPQAGGARRPSTATISVTTFNRPDFCVAQMRTLASAPETLARVDTLLVVDQGTQKVRDEPGFAEAAAALGEKFRLVEQANLGGSGGFARGMHETVSAGASDHVLLLDDDVILEPEGVLRALDFADHTRRPTIVGGHMFNLYERSTMHSYGERVNEWRFFWGAVPGTKEAHDFAARNLRQAAWLHKRVDVDFNGWWMCLIPVEVIQEVGLSLPVFIKWDDAEFGLRARAAGYPTVSLPGAAVWHMPWTDKDDTIDWQAYYHQRNRWLAALLYSPYDRGGNLSRESFQVDVKHLLSLQYSAVRLRLMALEDLLSGPEHLHATLPTKLGEIRAIRAGMPDSTVRKDPAAFPEPKRRKPPKHGKEPEAPTSVPGGIVRALTGAVRQLRPVAPSAMEQPEATVPAMDARWWRLSQLDSAVVSSADGTGASWYRRDRESFQSMLRRSVALHQHLVRVWPQLAQEYRAALPEFTSPQAWAPTFSAHPKS